MKHLYNNRFLLIGIAVGAIGGYLYYHFVGCASGTCAISSRPLNSTLYGGLVGGLAGSMIPKSNKSKQ